jgi:hypothetical protein
MMSISQASQSAGKSVSQRASQSVSEQVNQSASKSVSQRASQSVSQQASQSVSEQVSQTASKSVSDGDTDLTFFGDDIFSKRNMMFTPSAVNFVLCANHAISTVSEPHYNLTFTWFNTVFVQHRIT